MSRTMTGRRYRMEPTPTKAAVLRRELGAARWLYNAMLAYREEAWLAARAAGASGIAANLGYVHLCSLLPDLKRKYPWLAKCSNEALRGALRNLDRAFQSFFSGHGAHPNYKRRGDTDSLSFGDPKKFSVHGDMVRLPKVGWLKLNLHRPLGGKARTATVSYDGKHWYVSFAVAGDFTLPNAGNEAVGVDLGVVNSVGTSTGEKVHFRTETPRETKRLRYLQRQAARRKKGSERRRRTLGRIARIRRHIANRRRDAAHKITHRLATTHRVVAIENLKVRNMTRSAAGTVEEPGTNVAAKSGLNRSIQRQGWHDFRRMLAYKCERSGAEIWLADPKNTSITCSRCGHIAPENRKNQAEFRCVACGFTLNADHNAAINILRAARPPAAGSAVAARGGSDISPACEPRTHLKARRGSHRSRKPARKTKLSVIP